MDSIYKYNDGRDCHHCMWLENKKKQGLPLPPPVFYKTDNCTVFGPSDHFKYSFMVVYGKSLLASSSKHKSLDFTTFLECAVNFIEYLNSKYDFNNLRFLINSNYSKHRYKEHLHGFVTANSEADERLFDKLFNNLGREGKVNVASEPYETDTVVNISTEEGREMIRSNVAKFLVNKLIPFGVKTEFDLARKDLILFLSFDRDNKSITGKIAF